MNQLAAICDSPEAGQCVREHLDGIFETECVPSDRLLEACPPGQYTIVDVDLTDFDRSEISNIG
jgi:hypothetical protein